MECVTVISGIIQLCLDSLQGSQLPCQDIWQLLLNLSTASSPLIRDRKKCLNSAQQWEQQVLVTVCNAYCC
jgi:hypothetical protein